MPKRINRAIELLEQDQPIYYTGLHTFSKEFLTFEQELRIIQEHQHLHLHLVLEISLLL